MTFFHQHDRRNLNKDKSGETRERGSVLSHTTKVPDKDQTGTVMVCSYLRAPKAKEMHV